MKLELEWLREMAGLPQKQQTTRTLTGTLHVGRGGRASQSIPNVTVTVDVADGVRYETGWHEATIVDVQGPATARRWLHVGQLAE